MTVMEKEKELLPVRKINLEEVTEENCATARAALTRSPGRRLFFIDGANDFECRRMSAEERKALTVISLVDMDNYDAYLLGAKLSVTDELGLLTSPVDNEYLYPEWINAQLLFDTYEEYKVCVRIIEEFNKKIQR